MTNFEAIIFDCDGVLFKSHRANLAYYNRIFTHFKYPLVTDPSSAEATICHTASSPQVLARLMEASEVEEALRFAQGLDYREFIPFMTEAPGLKSSLTRLAASRPLAVATNRGNSMQQVLEHFGLARHFAVVVTSRDVENSKPAPDMLLLAAKRLRIKAQRCLFVGDSELDQLAAKQANMPFVAFGEVISAEFQVNSHDELVTALLGEGGQILQPQ